MKPVYERIKEVRKKLKMSQVDFSERILLSKTYYGDIEIGKKKVNDRVIFIVSKQFNVNEDWIRTGKGNMFNENTPDFMKDKLMYIYNQLNISLRDCLVEQSEILLKLQKNKKVENV
jgi:transcriptional regulator with XRE-family HTH domain